ncbi:DUF6516 family protein [Sulfuricella sp. T08]|uniref:toxin-antitoxin system TumE family protein n=1 Tax=Sulfuricella sp. T08 TaxID=1632857 RepID=UPI0007509D9B|nr:DUF6516 family protein [Sulfuricella sp. T08]
MDNMKADLITRFRNISEDGTGIEMVIWLVHESVPPSEHKYKYRLVYIENGCRVVGFDNERGKGDHKHVGNVEMPYVFATPDRLVDDFIEEVERWKQGH